MPGVVYTVLFKKKFMVWLCEKVNLYLNKTKWFLWFLAGVSSSSSSSSASSGTNGFQNIPFAQTQNPLGYNYGGVYPSYPYANPYGGQIQAATLNNRNSFEEAVPVLTRNGINPQLYAPNTLNAPLDYGQLWNIDQQQRNEYVSILV